MRSKENRLYNEAAGDALPLELCDNFTVDKSGVEHDDFVRSQSNDQRHEVLPVATDRERLAAIVIDEQFIPTSRREVTLALGGIKSRAHPAGFGHYLNEVLCHQQKEATGEGSGVTDPTAALRAITGDVSHFAKEARADRTMIYGALDFLEERRPSEVLSQETWQFDQFMCRAVRVGLHHRNVQEALTTESRDDDRRIDVSLTVTKEDIQQWMASRRVDAVHNLLSSAGTASSNRQKFWQDRLRESRCHCAVRKMAGAALEQLGASVEVQE